MGHKLLEINDSSKIHRGTVSGLGVCIHTYDEDEITLDEGRFDLEFWLDIHTDPTHVCGVFTMVDGAGWLRTGAPDSCIWCGPAAGMAAVRWYWLGWRDHLCLWDGLHCPEQLLFPVSAWNCPF